MEIAKILNTVYLSFRDPKALVKTWDKRKMDISDAVVAVLVMSIVAAVLSVLVQTAIADVNPLKMDMGVLIGGIIYWAIVYGVILNWVVDAVLVYIIAVILGGKGDPIKLATMMAFPAAAAISLAWIPVNILVLLIALYAFYVVYLFLQPAMKLKPDKAAITLVATVIVYFVIMSAISISVMSGTKIS
jgi:hypothetical protein